MSKDCGTTFEQFLGYGEGDAGVEGRGDEGKGAVAGTAGYADAEGSMLSWGRSSGASKMRLTAQAPAMREPQPVRP